MTTGYIWLLTIWLVVADHVPDSRPTSGVAERLYRIVDGFGPAAAIAAMSLIAYLVGSMTVVTRSPSWLRLGATPLGRLAALNEYRLRELANNYASRVLKSGRVTMRNIDEIILGSRVIDFRERSADHEEYDGYLPSSRLERSRSRHQPEPDQALLESGLPQLLTDVLHDELTQLATRLHAQNRDLYDDYDRHRAEAEFRLSIVAPLIALISVLAFAWHPVVLVGLVLPMVLGVQGWLRERQAETVIHQALFLTIIESPTLARIDKVLDQTPSENPTLSDF